MASICPNCATPLRFVPEHNALFCDRCGGTFAPESIETEGRSSLEDQEIISLAEAYGAEEPEEMGDFNVYTCSSCGGEIVINSTEASTLCIYCGSPSIVFSRVSKFRKPKFIMPFRISKSEAENIIRNKLQENKYLPASIRNFETDSIRGIYIPYHIVNVEYRDAIFASADVYPGKERKIEYFTRAGASMFADLPIESSTKLSNDTSVKLEPYYLQDLVPFDEDYLTGFYSDMCDISRIELDKTIKERIREMFTEEVKKDIKGESKQIIYSHPFIQHQKPPVYAMLPVWFLTFFYKGVHHTILVNGQTGKIVCGLPGEKKKIVRNVVLISLAVMIPLTVITYFLFWVMPIMMLEIIVGFIFSFIAYFNFKELRKSIRQTQSKTTFGFVKKRQG